MAEELWSVLTRFHREVIKPDNDAMGERIVSTLRDEMNTKFDAFWQELADLESRT